MKYVLKHKSSSERSTDLYLTTNYLNKYHWWGTNVFSEEKYRIDNLVNFITVSEVIAIDYVFRPCDLIVTFYIYKNIMLTIEVDFLGMSTYLIFEIEY